MAKKWLILLPLIGGLVFFALRYQEKGDEPIVTIQTIPAPATEPSAKQTRKTVTAEAEEKPKNIPLSARIPDFAQVLGILSPLLPQTPDERVEAEEKSQTPVPARIPGFAQVLEILSPLLPKTPVDYRDAPLQERLDMLHAKRGDSVFVRIFKEESILELWIKTDTTFELLKTYPICAYSGDLGPKIREGDGQAPEGFYRVYKNSLNPNSRFHLAFNLGFPNEYDRAYGRTGSFLMVHGNCVSVGCYAMTDQRIEEIYALVEAALDEGETYVPVHIFPFRMTHANLLAYQDDRWFDFWNNLQEGYDYFETEKCPPEVEVSGKRYTVHEGRW